jgi:pectin methylesterase-like acyl-CoA thioesterase
MAGLASASALLLLLPLAVRAQAANTLYVKPDGTGDYTSIQAAINAAQPGDTIVVAAGTFKESLDWEGADLTIRGAGAGQSIIDPSGGPGGRCGCGWWTPRRSASRGSRGPPGERMRCSTSRRVSCAGWS